MFGLCKKKKKGNINAESWVTPQICTCVCMLVINQEQPTCQCEALLQHRAPQLWHVPAAELGSGLAPGKKNGNSDTETAGHIQASDFHIISLSGLLDESKSKVPLTCMYQEEK